MADKLKFGQALNDTQSSVAEKLDELANATTNGNDSVNDTNVAGTGNDSVSGAESFLGAVDAANQTGVAALNIATDNDDPAGEKVGIESAIAGNGADTTVVTGELAERALDVYTGDIEASLHDDSTQFTCQPAQNLTLGPWKFENGMLKVPASELNDFANLMKQQPVQIRNMVKPIDRDAADRIVRARLSAMRQGIATTADTLAPAGGEG